MAEKQPKITGVGGVFIKCDDPDSLREWYGKSFGLKTNQYGIMFETRGAENPEEKQYLQWSTFSKGSDYFAPSQKEFMVNYRVQNIEALVEQLRADGVTICDEIETYSYGKFVHVMDPEGNKIELWEPIDSDFTEDYEKDANS